MTLPKFAIHPGYLWINGVRTFQPSQTIATCYGLPAGSWFSWLAAEYGDADATVADWHSFIHLYPQKTPADYAAALDAALREASRH